MRSDDPFDDPFFDKAESPAKTGFRAVAVAQMIGLGIAVVAALVAAIVAWTHAPPVGGEWWPYIRALIALVSAVIGFKTGAVIAYVVFAAGMAISTRWW